MKKLIHEVRDPIHGFIRFDHEELAVINSTPFQRLRHIHQLAMSYLVYPSATHRRFEHSLGVMELSSRIFDEVTDPANHHPSLRESLPELFDRSKLSYWRMVVRMAALSHDLGHLPFSHAGEDLLPDGKTHEDLTRSVIESDEMMGIWRGFTSVPKTEHLVKLALGPEKYGAPMEPWEALLSEIITGDALGADRMDYLLRDAYHAGVPYGRFDHLRLLQGVRILPVAEDGVSQPALGIEEGARSGAESLLVGRQFMYTEVYHHPVRLAYNLHLQDFLKSWLKNGRFPMDVRKHLALTDNEVLTAMATAATKGGAGADAARRILNRQHFKKLYSVTLVDRSQFGLGACDALVKAASKEFGPENVRSFKKALKGGRLNFPVLLGNGEILSSLNISHTLHSLSPPLIEYIFIEPSLRDRAQAWLTANKPLILK